MSESNVNITTIAKMAGVSSTTVSNLINCTESIPISDEKRTKIMEAMRNANYRPSAASSSLRRKTELPGKAVFIFGSYAECDPLETTMNPMISALLVELNRNILKELNLSFEVRKVADENSKDAWNETIASASAVIAYARLDPLLFALAERRNIPLTVISETKDLQIRGTLSPLPPIDRICCDAASHLEKIMFYLVEKGKRHFAFVSSVCVAANGIPAAEPEAKIAQFKAFLAQRPELSGELLYPPRFNPCLSMAYEARNAYDFVRKKDLKNFDAIVCHNDLVAEGVIWALQEQGLKPGKDVMVCGEGDYSVCRYFVPGITTISYDKEEAAKHICSILKRRLQENRMLGETFFCHSSIIERESTGGQEK